MFPSVNKIQSLSWGWLIAASASLSLAADKPPVVKEFTDDDFRKHVAALKKKLPNDDFRIVIQKPFVVVGDEPLEDVREWATGTVKWAVDRLKKDYFTKDPERILDVWLFKDKESYETNVAKVFAEKPHTPFGYYSSRHAALIMNIDTGGGTLVHEIVHPFIAANFPECPAWFNEGLASLYEQCGDNDGRIWGYTNWRLRGLHGAIGDKSLPSFEKLCGTTTAEFYNADRGANYAQARYLCYYLQEKRLLKKFYHEFRQGAKDDPSGYQSLRRVLGDPDMDEFQSQWQDYVLKLQR